MPGLEQELRAILENFAMSRADDFALNQSTEHTYRDALSEIEKSFKEAGYVLKEDK